MIGSSYKGFGGRSLYAIVALGLCSTTFIRSLAGQEVKAPTVAFGKEAYKHGLPADFQPYLEIVPGTNLSFVMVPIPGGEFTLGSPEKEEGREPNEGPQVNAAVGPFWMAAYEVTWDEYDQFSFSYDIKAAKQASQKGLPFLRTEMDRLADAVTRPTPPYVDMTFGKGHDRFPASCMTSHAAIHYSRWISAKAGKNYRLPTEAEWEFACRAGSKAAHFWGDKPELIDEYAWHSENSEEKPHPIGLKKPNPWGLYDIIGNVREWCADEYNAEYYSTLAKNKLNLNPAIKAPTTTKAKHIWHAVRGGSWMDDKTWCRSAWRVGAEEEWSLQDPQLPKSIWWHTDAQHTGFRLVRPYVAGAAPASAAPAAKIAEPSVPVSPALPVARPGSVK